MARPVEKLRFEEALARLEQIVQALESGQIGVEETLARYEEALALEAHCRAILDRLEQRIRKVQLEAGGPPRVEPFEPPPESASPEAESSGS